MKDILGVIFYSPSVMNSLVPEHLLRISCLNSVKPYCPSQNGTKLFSHIMQEHVFCAWSRRAFSPFFLPPLQSPVTVDCREVFRLQHPSAVQHCIQGCPSTSKMSSTAAKRGSFFYPKPDLENELFALFSVVSCISSAVQYPPGIPELSFVQTKDDKISGYPLGPIYYCLPVNAVAHSPIMICCSSVCNLPLSTV